MEIQSYVGEQYIAKRTHAINANQENFGIFHVIPDDQNETIKQSNEVEKMPFSYSMHSYNNAQAIIKRDNNEKLHNENQKVITKHVLTSIANVFPIILFIFSIVFCSIAIVVKIKSLPVAINYNDFVFPSESKMDEILLLSIDEKEEIDEEINVAPLPATVSYSKYKVIKNDTLDAISKKYNIKLDTLISINNIQSVKRLQVGTVLKIPSCDGIIYSVKKNDSLAEIAKKQKVEIIDLIDINNLDSDTLQPGQTLFIPGAKLSSYELKKALGQLVIWPIIGRISSYYGYRPNPFTGVRQFHTGLDVVAPVNTKVKVIMDGTVSETGYNSTFGNYVIVKHAGNYQTLYGHLNKVSTKKGRVLSQGETVGLLGSTGLSTGPHLHLGVYKNGKHMNPLTLLNGKY